MKVVIGIWLVVFVIFGILNTASTQDVEDPNANACSQEYDCHRNILKFFVDDAGYKCRRRCGDGMFTQKWCYIGRFYGGNKFPSIDPCLPENPHLCDPCAKCASECS